MRCLTRNKTTFYYALYQGEISTYDEYGNENGAKLTYGDPVQMSANVSAAQGIADVEMFGINTAYSKIIVTDDMSCPLKEDSIIWLGFAPDENGEAGEVKHNYAVVRVAKSINSITYAIQEVKVS